MVAKKNDDGERLDDIKQIGDLTDEPREKLPEKAVYEAHAGKEDLVQRVKEKREAIKEGRSRSGITSEFGKVLLVGLEALGLGKAAKKVRDAVAVVETSNPQESGKVADAVKPGEAAKPAEAAKPVDQDKVIDRTAKLVTAMARGLFIDEESIFKALRGTTEAEREAIEKLYRQTTGKDLESDLKDELSGADVDRAMRLLNLKDAEAVSVPEGVNRQKLMSVGQEIYEKTEGSYLMAGAVVAGVMNTLTPDEIRVMDSLFKEEYGIGLDARLKRVGTSLDERIADAAERIAEEHQLEKEKGRVDRGEMARVADELEKAKNAMPPGGYGMMVSSLGWDVGEHPATRLVQDLSEAELDVLKEVYKERHGKNLKDELARIPFGEGERLERILERDDSYFRAIPAEARPQLRERAEELYRAMVGAGTREGKVYRNLEKLTQDERRAVKEYFYEITGDTLEDWIKDDFSGDEELKALNYLRYGSADETANLYLALSENDDAEVRQTIMTMSQRQIEALDKAWRERYGKSLSESILKDDGLRRDTREAMEIYLKGAQNRTPEDWQKLIDISLGPPPGSETKKTMFMASAHLYENRGNYNMFKEIMASAPQDVRDKFMADGGKEKIKYSFHMDTADALEYASGARLSTARKIEKNDTVDDDEDAIVKAIDTMPDDEKKLYLRGARLNHEFEEGLKGIDSTWEYLRKQDAGPDRSSWSEEDTKAYETFRKINSAIDGPCDDEECRDWRDRAVMSGGVDTAVQEVEKLSWEQLQEMKASPQAKEQFLRDKNIDLLSEHARKKVVGLLDKKLSSDKPEDLAYADGKSIEKALEWRSIGHAKLPPDQEKVIAAIQNMRLEDQQRYRNDADFRERIDDKVKEVLTGANEDAAMRMLDSVARGGHPVGDFIDKINIEAGKDETSEPLVIRYLEDEFKKSEEKGESPSLRERINSPRTAEDKELAARLDKALHRALDADEYEKWAVPVLAVGRLTFEQKMQLNKEDGDRKTTFADINSLASAKDPASVAELRMIASDRAYREKVLAHLPEDQRDLASRILVQGESHRVLEHVKTVSTSKDQAHAAEREKLVSDAAYRQQLLGHLPERERAVAEALLKAEQPHPVLAHIQAVSSSREPAAVAERQRIARDVDYRRQLLRQLPEGQRALAEHMLNGGDRVTDGGMKPEDMVRSYVLGTGVSKEEMIAVIKQLTPEQNEAFRSAYALKYRADVVAVLEDKLEGKDESSVLREVRRDARTTRELFQDVRETVASSNSGVGADLTEWWGSQAGDLAEDSVLQIMAKMEDAAARGEEIPVWDEELNRLARDAYEYTDMFEAAKEKTADALSDIVLGVATIAIPGGLSLRALLVLSSVGGGAKVAMKAALTGDASVGDFAGGFVDTALSVVGPAQMAKAAGLGKRAATRATREVMESGAKRVVREGGEELLEAKMRGAVAQAVADGTGTVSDKALKKIVNEVARDGATKAERELLERTVKESLHTQLEAEVRGGFKKVVTGVALEGGAGFVGGFGGGVVRAAFEWDSGKSFSENMSRLVETGVMSGAFGTAGALGFSAVFRAGGRAFRLFGGKEAPEAARILGAPEVVAQEGGFAIARPKDAPAPAGEPVRATADGIKAEYSRVGDSDYYVNRDGQVFKKVGSGAEGGVELLPDPHAMVAVDERAMPKVPEAKAGQPAARGSGAAEGDSAGARPADGEAKLARAGDSRPAATRQELPGSAADSLAKMKGDGIVAGRPAAADFPPPTAAERLGWRRKLDADLREVPVDGAANVYEKIMQAPDLRADQKERILDMLAEVKAHYERLEPNMDGYQNVNWKHTRGEIDQVLEAARKNGLSADETESAILASIFSDSVKFPPGDRANFIVHNIDGAKAAAEILPRYFDLSVPGNLSKVEGIFHAIREHQIAPPEFMASISGNMIRGKLRAEGVTVTAEIGATIQSIQGKIARPFEAPRVVDADGVARIDFTPQERDLLKKIGVEEWYVPNPDSPWYGASRAVIDGDGLVNYATPDGWAKIAAIRGPGKEPWFQDATIFDSLKSARQSYDDAFSVTTERGRELARQGLARTEAAQARVKQRMEEWFNTEEAIRLGLTRNADGTIPFWDAPLKYPSDKAPLTPTEQAQFDFAQKIRERMVEELRQEQSVFMRAPGGQGSPGDGGGGAPGRPGHGTVDAASPDGARGPGADTSGTMTRDTVHDMKAVSPDEIAEHGAFREPGEIRESDFSPEVRSILDSAGVQGPERELVLEWISRNPLFRPESVHEFMRDSLDLTGRWPDLTPLSNQADAAGARLHQSYDTYRQQVYDALMVQARAADGSLDAELNMLLGSPEHLRKLASDGPDSIPKVASELGIDPQKLTQISDNLDNLGGLTAEQHLVVGDFLRARELALPELQSFQAAYDQRLADLQGMMDRFTDANGLARVKIAVLDDSVMGQAGGFYQNGRITLRKSDLLANGNPVEFARTLYHELTHSHQDFIVARSVLADLPEAPTAAQMERLQELRDLESRGPLDQAQADEMARLDALYQTVRSKYHESAGGDISLEHLTAVLRNPVREALEESPFRAKVLMKEFREADGFSDWERAIKELETIDAELRNVDGAGGTIDLIRRIADDDGELRSALFGLVELPRDLREQVNVYRYLQAGLRFHPMTGQPLALDVAQAQAGLRALLAEQRDRVSLYRDAVFTQYISGLHETEAYVIDRLAIAEGRRLQAPERLPADDFPPSAADAGDFADEVTDVDIRVPDMGDDVTNVSVRRLDMDDEATSPGMSLRDFDDEATSPGMSLRDFDDEATSPGMSLRDFDDEVTNANARRPDVEEELTDADITTISDES